MAEWLSVAEAAKISGYHRIYLLELLRNGKVKARKIVTVWQVDKTSLLVYIRNATKSKDRRRGARTKKRI